MVRLLVALCIMIPHTARAARPICFSAAYLAPNGEPSPELIAQTYVDLLEATTTGLTLGDRATLVALENPFRLPDDLVERFPTFAGKLAEFERMLDKLGWNSEAIRNHVVSALRHHDQHMRQVADRQEVADVDQEPNRRHRFPFDLKARLTADGRYFVSVEPVRVPGGGLGTNVRSYDTQTGELHEQLLAAHTLKSWALGSDGKSVAFPGPRWLDVYPLTNGQLDLPGRRRIGDANDSLGGYLSLPGQTPSQFYVWDELRYQVTRYDAATNQKIEIDNPVVNRAVYTQGAFESWGRIPGTDDLWFQFSNQLGDSKIHLYGITPHGKAVRRSPPYSLKTSVQERPNFFPQGGFVIAAGPIAQIGGPATKNGLKPLTPPVRASPPQRPPTVVTANPLPDGRVLTKTREGEAAYLDLFSFEGQHVGGYPIPGEVHEQATPVISPDGRTIYLTLKTGGVFSIAVSRLLPTKK